MRRPSRLGLAALILLLVVCGGYIAFWFIVAGRLQSGIAEWAESLRAQQLELSWRTLRVGGFPLAFRAELNDAQLRDSSPRAGFQVQAARFNASARPWNFRVWRLAAPDGLNAASPGFGSEARLAAQAANGTVAFAAPGGVAVWFALDAPSAEFGVALGARRAEFWLNLPAQPPQSHTEPQAGIALAVQELTLPEVPQPLRNPLDEIALGATLLGPLPAASPRQAAAAWRDAGGTLELDHLDLRWGPLAITGSGTLALDAALQPEGAFSGSLQGYDELLRALVAGGRMRPGDANIAGLALGFLSRTGPGGRPQIPASFRIQNGAMYLGPAKIGPAPRINWP